MAKHVLIVDDEARIREVTRYALEREGFEVSEEAQASSVVSRVARGGVDLLVLDVMLPDGSGLDLCRQIRALPDAPRATPVLFLSARGEEVDRIVGLEIGGDDYLVKPFSPRELVARVRALFRRVSEPQPAAQPKTQKLVHGAIEIDLERHEVQSRRELVPLTPTELGLLAALLERPGIVLSRGQLMQRAYRYDNLITERTIDTHVRRIRKKFKPSGVDPIETVHGVGYRASEAKA